MAKQTTPAKASGGNTRKQIALAKRGKRATSNMRNASGKSHGRASKGQRNVSWWMSGT